MLYYITYKYQTLVGNIKYAIDLVNIVSGTKMLFSTDIKQIKQ